MQRDDDGFQKRGNILDWIDLTKSFGNEKKKSKSE